MTPDEIRIVDMLAAAWNAYLALPVEHPCDRTEFMRAIHDAQARVLMRPARRDLESRSPA